MEKQRDFVFTDTDFVSICSLVREHTGIALSDAKRDLVYSRLSRRLRALKLDNFKDYCKLVNEENAEELTQFTNAITTNLTSFFREQHHFTYLKNTVIPSLLKDNSHSRRIRIWSAGCSTGEEPYSLAMTIKDAMPSTNSWDIQILATDLDSNVLARAEAGLYDLERVQGIPKSYLKKYFINNREKDGSKARINPDVADMITFKQLNLLKEWRMTGPFDIIFCRNVVIYFDKNTQRILFDRYADLMSDNGHLFIGHSETLFKVTDRFKLIGQTIYRKIN